MRDLEPGTRPEPETTEGGIWMRVDRIEAALLSSGDVIRDPALQEYVSGVVCRVAGEFCQDVRAYVVRSPEFNARAYPNGMLILQSGLLLRVRGEAELAAIVGHEVAHYIKRHALKRWMDASAKRNLIAVSTLALGQLSPAGLLSILPALAMMDTSLAAYDRDNEREADRLGLSLMCTAGYPPQAAVGLWEYVVREAAVDREGGGGGLWSTHPTDDERLSAIRTRASQLPATAGEATGRAAFLAATEDLRAGWSRTCCTRGSSRGQKC